jgi:hypothetical protein
MTIGSKELKRKILGFLKMKNLKRALKRSVYYLREKQLIPFFPFYNLRTN